MTLAARGPALPGTGGLLWQDRVVPDTADRLREPASALSGALRLLGETATSSEDGLALRAASLADEVEQRLVPRLGALGGPLLVVVAGASGVGKSTLVNSLVGRVVSPAGVLRPTTRGPILVHHPDDQLWFTETGPPLPGVPVRMVADEHLPRGLVLVDTPDVDAVADDPSAWVAGLVDMADLWLAVTSALRYADALPWHRLRQVAQRQTPVAVVLSRVAPGDVAEVSAYLAALMQEQALSDSPLLVVAEEPESHGLLPAEAVTELRAWLEALVADPDSRALMSRASLAGGFADVSTRLHVLAAEAAAGDRRRDTAAARALARFEAALADLVGHLGDATGRVDHGDRRAS
jgi:energy-coupling factor transporter ATP-binding protein EcfA2